MKKPYRPEKDGSPASAGAAERPQQRRARFAGATARVGFAKSRTARRDEVNDLDRGAWRNGGGACDSRARDQNSFFFPRPILERVKKHVLITGSTGQRSNYHLYLSRHSTRGENGDIIV